MPSLPIFCVLRNVTNTGFQLAMYNDFGNEYVIYICMYL